MIALSRRGNAQETVQWCGAAMVATAHREVVAEPLTAPPSWIRDQPRPLGADIEGLPGYEGIGWAV